MVDPDTEQIGKITNRLLAIAASSHETAPFLDLALTELAAAANSPAITLVRAANGEWTAISNSNPPIDVPTQLLASVADTESLASNDDWLAVPMLPIAKRQAPATPAILLASIPKSGPTINRQLLQEVTPRFASVLILVSSRSKAIRQAKRSELAFNLQAQVTGSDTSLAEIADFLTETLGAEHVHLLQFDRESDSFVAVTAATTGSISTSADWLAPLAQPAKDETTIVRCHGADDCAMMATALQHEVGSALIAPIAPHSNLPEQTAPAGIIIATNLTSHSFSEEDVEDLASVARCLSEQFVTAPNEQQVTLLGDSRQIRELRERIDRIAPTELPVLIMGENGTGKEVVSRQIHALSPRDSQPFLAVNCGALSETLLESELFGHEKGAFTDAVESRAGKFEAADGGTLFLDEIGELSPRGQVKLLRVLEEKIIVRVGGTNSIDINTRVLAATNRDLAAMVREGSFREDLFFRLNAVTIELPPLRDRPQDIGELAEHFLGQFATKAGRSSLELDSEAHKRLRSHSWPGNVRELRNLMERAAFLVTGETIGAAALQLPSAPLSASVENLNEATRVFQVAHIESQIAAVAGNMTEAASRLGLHRSNLYRKMKQLGMQADGVTDG